MDNHVCLILESKSENVSLARMVSSAFIAPLDPSIGEVSDIKTAVSEAVTNAIIHGYENVRGEVNISLRVHGRTITIEVSDKGVGIGDIEKAREPMFTTKPEMERSGLGFTVIESFMDKVEIDSAPNKGTKITMTKKLNKE